ncbi:MAG: hypothetical protein G01um101448_331 [Parcubacteria group bacterium Gr01-1014_48]|nr:MAG: hypothetical protein Greene041614_899 [Parcubacteria group bacterium Greene0416_14]TSC74127.1 MAG: hypothetical protein G01um101448_331 [Parcubacteria group bacterium Gr01-1014_48]TSD00171.1 MAG: hypothetical protein Greene101415_947 [Parcubacteria group bacterium Greene1014_15]
MGRGENFEIPMQGLTQLDAVRGASEVGAPSCITYTAREQTERASGEMRQVRKYYLH